MYQISLEEWCTESGIGLVPVPEVPEELVEEQEDPEEKEEINKCDDCLYLRNGECKCYMTIDKWPEWQQGTPQCKGFALKNFSDELKRKYRKKGRWDT